MKIKLTPEEDAALTRCCNCILDMILRYCGEGFRDMRPKNTLEQDNQNPVESMKTK